MGPLTAQARRRSSPAQWFRASCPADHTRPAWQYFVLASSLFLGGRSRGPGLLCQSCKLQCVRSGRRTSLTGTAWRPVPGICLWFLFVCFLRFHLFIHERHTERQRPRQREKQAPHGEPDVGPDPRTRGHALGRRQVLHSTPWVPLFLPVFYTSYTSLIPREAPGC